MVGGVDITDAVASVKAGLRIVGGQITTATAADTVVTGLDTVAFAIAVFDSDPADGSALVTCTVGDQTSNPAAGSIVVKTWQTAVAVEAAPTPPVPETKFVADVKPIAATVFGRKVNWIAGGTIRAVADA